MASLKTLAKREEKKRKFESGHSLCSGCGLPIAVRTILNSTDGPVVASNATGCLEVATTRFPTSAWNIPWIHNAFENAAATMRLRRIRFSPGPADVPRGPSGTSRLRAGRTILPQARGCGNPAHARGKDWMPAFAGMSGDRSGPLRFGTRHTGISRL